MKSVMNTKLLSTIEGDENLLDRLQEYQKREKWLMSKLLQYEIELVQVPDQTRSTLYYNNDSNSSTQKESACQSRLQMTHESVQVRVEQSTFTMSLQESKAVEIRSQIKNIIPTKTQSFQNDANISSRISINNLQSDYNALSTKAQWGKSHLTSATHQELQVSSY